MKLQELKNLICEEVKKSLYEETSDIIIKSTQRKILFTSKTAKSIKGAVEEAVEQGISLLGANLKSANLKKADLYHADLRNADLSNADLRSADLRRANLSGVSLGGVNLGGAKLDGTIF
jgi:uncharacterized protein YjbI with pentapeptide repeats